jgi:predicted small lipoprotein YifL
MNGFRTMCFALATSLLFSLAGCGPGEPERPPAPVPPPPQPQLQSPG